MLCMQENPMEALNDFVANIPDLQNAIGQGTRPGAREPETAF